MQVALQRVFVEGAAQPGTTPAKLRGDLSQGVETLELVAVQMLLHIEPKGQLCARGECEREARAKEKGGKKKWDNAENISTISFEAASEVIQQLFFKKSSFSLKLHLLSPCHI